MKFLLNKNNNSPIEIIFFDKNRKLLCSKMQTKEFLEETLTHQTTEKTKIFHTFYKEVIVMESKTASILAMANYPNYNPNYFSDYSTKTYLNWAVNSAYEPGSTFKAQILEDFCNTSCNFKCE